MRGWLAWGLLATCGCGADATVRSITLRLEDGPLLEQLDALTLDVWDAEGLSCSLTGALEGTPRGAALVDHMSLPIGQETTIELSAGARMFVVEAFAATERVALGCLARDLAEGESVALEIALHRLVAPDTCGDGVLDAREQCDDGDVTPDDGCDADCETEEGNLPQSTAGAQLAPRAAAAPAGLFVATWFDANGDLGAPIRMAFRDQDGAPLEGGLANDRDANESARGDPNLPEVAVSRSGSVAVWEDFSGTAASAPDVKARFFGPDARPLDPAADLPVNVTTGDRQGTPAVAMLDAGSTLVVWQDETQASPGLAGRRFEATGVALDAADLLLAGEVGASAPAVTGLGDAFLLAYRAGGISVRRIPVAGAPEEHVATGAGATAQDPDVAALADGSLALVVWVEAGAVRGQRVDPAGGLAGEPIEISEAGDGTAQEPSVAGGADRFAVLWESDGDIRCRLFDAAGEPVVNRVTGTSGSFAVNRLTDDRQHAATAAILGDRLLAIWQDEGVRDEDPAPPGIRHRYIPLSAP